MHIRAAVAAESDEETSERLCKLEAEETESEESLSESASGESETAHLEQREMVTPNSPSAKEIYSDSEEEIEKVRAMDKKRMSREFNIATAKYSSHSERLVEEEQYKQKKGNESVDMKEQERESELQAKASRGKLQKPQLKERESMKETDSGMKTKRLGAHSSEKLQMRVRLTLKIKN